MHKNFDFVVVGAGSAGCVLAERLSRDSSISVLLLEAGGWDSSPLIGMPMGIKTMTPQNLFRWADMSGPDPELGNRPHAIPHGKVIGGGSSINYMAHTRGHPGIYDDWASNGAAGWSYADVLPYFKETEAWSESSDAMRGASGPIGARRSTLNDPIRDAWFQALQKQGFTLTDDHNGKDPNGFGILQYSIRAGRRSSAAKEFLHPALKRSNLHVLVNAHATRVLFDGRRATGVEYEQGGQLHTIHAGRTILSSGAINTPQLLMLSGIGPADHLRSVGIRPLVDLPVGRGLEDHLGVDMIWHRREPGSFHRSLRLDRAALDLARAMLFRTGPASCLPGVILGFWNTTDPARKPDLQFYMQAPPLQADWWFPGIRAPYQDALCARVQLVAQQSRGEVLLRTSRCTDRPQIHYRSLTEPADLDLLRKGVKSMWEVVHDTAMEPYRGTMVLPQAPLNSDEKIDEFIRATAAQQYHPGSTCRMGSGEDSVVDPQLNVHGIDGLGIVDASVMPKLVATNPNIPVMMMAAKAGDMWLKNGKQ